MKLVINRCFGGFGLSAIAQAELSACKHDHSQSENRACLALIELVERIGERASGTYAELEVVEIPDNATSWYIDEYDGAETVREGRSWP